MSSYVGSKNSYPWSYKVGQTADIRIEEGVVAVSTI
jgi:hypothetical protein